MSQKLQLTLFLVGGLMVCYSILANLMAEKRLGFAMFSLGIVVGLWSFLLWSAVLSGLLAGYGFDSGGLLETAVEQYWRPYLGFWMLAGGLIAAVPQFGQPLKKLIRA